MNSKWRDSIDLVGLKQKSHSVVVKGTVASFPMERTKQFNTGNLICAAAVVLNLKSLHDKKETLLLSMQLHVCNNQDGSGFYS